MRRNNEIGIFSPYLLHPGLRRFRWKGIPTKEGYNFEQRLQLCLRAALWFFKGDEETYIVFMAKIYSLQCLPSYALHEMFWHPNENKEAAQTHFLV